MNKELEVTPRTEKREKKPLPSELQEVAKFIQGRKQEAEELRRHVYRELGKKGAKASNKVRKYYDKKYALIAKGLASIGLSDADIAGFLGVRPDSFKRWKQSKKALALAIKEGQSLRNLSLTEELRKSSRNGVFAVQIFLAKNWLGMTDRVDTKMSGEVGITYKSNIPQEKGRPGPEPTSIKKRK